MNRRDSLKSLLLGLFAPLLSLRKTIKQSNDVVEHSVYNSVELPTPSRHYVAADAAWLSTCDPNLPRFGEPIGGEPWDISKPFAVRYETSAVGDGMWLVLVYYRQFVKVNA